MKEYIQKKSKTEIKFTFDKTKLHYFIKDEKSKGEFSIAYDYISYNSYEVTHSKDVFKYYSTYLLVLGIVTLIAGVGALMLIGSLIMYILYKRSIVTYTVFTGNDRRIFVIHDENHDEIIKEMLDRRSEYMKHKYAILNPHNSPEHELRKFELLLEEKVITEDEFNEFKFQLTKTENKLLN